MAIHEPLRLHRATVLPNWVDYNGHMNDAYYVLVFSHTTDKFIDHIGMDARFRESSQLSIFTLENHVCYLQEVKVGEPVRVTAQLLDFDAKRIRVFFAMFHGETSDTLATSEQLLMCIDMNGPNSAPFPPEIARRVKAIRADHTALATPKQAGRSVGIRR